jgi:hypothetical protein
LLAALAFALLLPVASVQAQSDPMLVASRDATANTSQVAELAEARSKLTKRLNQRRAKRAMYAERIPPASAKVVSADIIQGIYTRRPAGTPETPAIQVNIVNRRQNADGSVTAKALLNEVGTNPRLRANLGDFSP